MAYDGQVVIKIDDSDIKKVISTLDDYQKALNNLDSNSFVQNTDDAGNAVKDLVNRLDVDVDMKNFNASIRDGEKYLLDLALAGRSNGEEFKKVAASVQSAKQQVEQAKATVKQATQATKELQSANENVKFPQVANGANVLTGALKRLVGAYIGIRGAQLAFQKTMEAVEAFRTQERAVASLNTTLKNAGVYTAQYARDIQALASEIQGYSNYGDEAIIKAQALGQSFAGQIPITQKATKAVVDFAAATGMDLEQAFTLFGKSVGSSTNALARYGIELQKGMSDSQKMDAITRQLTERYAGQAKQMANTSIQLKNAMGDLSETIGKIFNPTVEKTQNLLIRATNALNNWLQTGIAVNKATNEATLKELYIKARDNIEKIADLEARGLVKGSGNIATYERLKKNQEEVIKRIKQIREEEAKYQNTLKPVKITDEIAPVSVSSANVSGGKSNVQKIKDDYEKLQQSVSDARREIELAAIAHGTSSNEVQNAFVKYNQLNTELSNISALFDTNKVKIEENKTAFEELNTEIDTSKDDIDRWSKSISSTLGSTLISALQGGGNALQSFSRLAISLLQNVLDKMLELAIISPILNSLTGGTGGTIFKGIKALFGSANGNVFKNGNVIPYAKGGIVNKPTVFPMANGAGLMGEAGAEAVMPLRRMSNGRLGVEADTSDSQQVVNIYNYSGASVETRKRDDNTMDVFIKRVNDALSSERTSSGFRNAYAREDKKGVQAA